LNWDYKIQKGKAILLILVCEASFESESYQSIANVFFNQNWNKEFSRHTGNTKTILN